MALAYRVEVYRSGIQRQFLPRGQGYRWMDAVKRQMVARCIATAPSRTGRLAQSHTSRIAPGSNQYKVSVVIGNNAEHAEWVHGGTPTHTSDTIMVLKPGGPGRNTVSEYAGQHFSKRRRHTVRGQKPNPWLEHACTEVAVLHGGRVVG